MRIPEPSAAMLPNDYQKVRAADSKHYKSRPWMTKYELDQVIALRTTHLAAGALPLVEVDPGFAVKSNMQLREIALRELREARLPYIVRRVMPNHKPEYWRVNELDLTAVRHLLR
jgi:DNA-directed RNA polymerase subunit K/omega